MHRTLALSALVVFSASPVWSQAPDCSGGEVHDDGMADGYVTGSYAGPDAVYHLVAQFTPTTYPFNYNEVCVNLRRDSGAGMLTFDVVVFEDVGGAPGSLLQAIPVTVQASGDGEWHSVGLGCGTEVSSGSVWIGIRFERVPENGLLVGIDNSDIGSTYHSTDGVDWSFTPFLILMVRARGYEGSGVVGAAGFRNGTGVNTPCYLANVPSINSTWNGYVNHGFVSGAMLTQIHMYALPGTGPVFGFGELLLDLSSPRLFKSTRGASSGQTDAHTYFIPNDGALMGLTFSSQGLVLGPLGIRLCNAYDLTIGC